MVLVVSMGLTTVATPRSLSFDWIAKSSEHEQMFIPLSHHGKAIRAVSE